MSTLVLCRTCGEKIYNLNAKNLFDRESYEMLDKIEILTGIRLDDDEDMPKHICACCYLDLNHSIAFRERCIKIQQLLHSGVEANAAAPDPLNTAVGRVTPHPTKSKKQPQRKVVRALTEPCHTSPQNHIVRARSPKQQLSINARMRDSSGQLRRRVIILREADAECDKTHNMLSHAKASSVDKSKRIAMEEAQQSASEDYDSATSDGSRNKMKCNARQTGISKTYVCDQCGKCFTDSSNLKVHILRHTGVKNFECEECNTKYFTRHLLNLHIRVRHQGEMPYACKYCDQRFFTSTSRCRHERVKHTRKLTYACRLCGKTYLTKSCLNKHEFLHTGERPYRCEICNVGFPRNTNLKIHYRSKQHQRRATEALDKQFNIIEAISDVETDIDSIIEDFDV